MVLPIYLYCCIVALWLFVTLNVWQAGRRDGTSPTEQRWLARMALLAPVWPLVLLWAFGPLLGRRIARDMGAVGRTIGTFMVDATRRKP